MCGRKSEENLELAVGNAVKVKKGGKEGRVVEVSFAGDDKSVRIYAVQLSETETRHFSAGELEAAEE